MAIRACENKVGRRMARAALACPGRRASRDTESHGLMIAQAVTLWTSIGGQVDGRCTAMMIRSTMRPLASCAPRILAEDAKADFADY
jgi:hypothetical protein